MHFGFALELSNVDLLNIDLLDTHLDLLDTDIPSILFVSIVSSRRLQDMSSRHLQDMSSRRLQDMSSRPTNVCWEKMDQKWVAYSLNYLLVHFCFNLKATRN